MEQNKECKVEGCKKSSLYKYHGRKGYCCRHYTQLLKYGKIFKKTKYDKNEIIDCKDYYEICLYNRAKRGEEQKEIARTKIDKDDLEKVKNYQWSIKSCKKNIKNYMYVKNTKNKIKLHQLIMGRKKGYEIDHINHKTLDNRKQNLRFVTHSQNLMNGKKRIDNTSGYKGVIWDKDNKKWRAQLHINQKHIGLGRFINKQDAINARRKAEKKYFGEFAYQYNY